jgi:hypothetical protein
MAVGKTGVALPSWVISTGGVLTIGAVAYGVFYPLAWLFSKFTAFPTSLSNALAMLLIGIMGTSAIAWWLYSGTGPQPIKFRPAPQETVYAKNFFNQEVEVDNNVFDHCSFENVRFLYHGLGRWEFKQSKFAGTISIETDNDAAKGLLELNNFFSKIPQITTKGLFNIDDKGNMSPIPGPIQAGKQ